jgi:hypothetical protein
MGSAKPVVSWEPAHTPARAETYCICLMYLALQSVVVLVFPIFNPSIFHFPFSVAILFLTRKRDYSATSTVH